MEKDDDPLPPEAGRRRAKAIRRQRRQIGATESDLALTLSNASSYDRQHSMIETLAVANYRSLRELIVPLGQLNLITGPNASGKSNLYRAMRLLAETAQGSVIAALAREGG